MGSHVPWRSTPKPSAFFWLNLRAFLLSFSAFLLSFRAGLLSFRAVLLSVRAVLLSFRAFFGRIPGVVAAKKFADRWGFSEAMRDFCLV